MTNKKQENVKKIKKAAALKYEPGKDTAPRVIAAGRGEAAENIIEQAGEHQVPLHKNESLAETLSLMKLGQEIPRELYDIVAEILVFVSKIDSEYGESYGQYK